MRRPSLNRIQYPPSISERTQRRVSDGVAEVVSVTCGVREVILFLILVKPSSFEESTLVVARMDWLPIRIVQERLLNITLEPVHVIGQLRTRGKIAGSSPHASMLE